MSSWLFTFLALLSLSVSWASPLALACLSRLALPTATKAFAADSEESGTLAVPVQQDCDPDCLAFAPPHGKPSRFRPGRVFGAFFCDVHVRANAHEQATPLRTLALGARTVAAAMNNCWTRTAPRAPCCLPGSSRVGPQARHPAWHTLGRTLSDHT